MQLHRTRNQFRVLCRSHFAEFAESLTQSRYFRQPPTFPFDVFPGSGNASRAGLERRPHAHPHDGAVSVGPEAHPLEVAGHAHDGQVQAALGPAR